MDIFQPGRGGIHIHNSPRSTGTTPKRGIWTYPHILEVDDGARNVRVSDENKGVLRTDDTATSRGGLRQPLSRHTARRRGRSRATLRGRLTRQCRRHRPRFFYVAHLATKAPAPREPCTALSFEGEVVSGPWNLSSTEARGFYGLRRAFPAPLFPPRLLSSLPLFRPWSWTWFEKYA